MENISTSNNINNQEAARMAAQTAPPQRGDIQVQKVPEVQVSEDLGTNPDEREQARFDAVKKAATKILNTNPFSPSIARFTIYREVGNDGASFVTRFTNINDGKVTFVKEQPLLTGFVQQQGTILNGVV